jgi:hypothetical protein
MADTEIDHVLKLFAPLESDAKRFKQRSRQAWERVHLKLQRLTLSVTKIGEKTQEHISLDDCGLVELKNHCVILNFPSKKQPSYWIFGMTPWFPDEKYIFKFSSLAEASKWKTRLYEASVHSSSLRCTSASS